jgi:alkylation response protein AidB-like acyl-CoA dehydrogenase
VTATEYAELHAELRSVARRVMSDPDAGWEMYARSGWLGLEVPPDLGGSGATLAETAIIVEEMARAASGGGFLGTAVLGIGALDMVEDRSDAVDLVAAMAEGRRRLSVAVAGPLGEIDLRSPPFRISRSAGGWLVTGRSSFVLDAARADQILLLAADDSAQAVIVVVESERREVIITPQPVLDTTRDLSVVESENMFVDRTMVWPLGVSLRAAVETLWNRTALAIAADSLGLMEAMLERTVGYAKQRKQFGRPIGSFQAVKHACADMLVRNELSRSLLEVALAELRQDPLCAVAASRAKSYICDAALQNVGKALQLHGGIGYTWDSGIHVYLKRAALNRSIFGSPIEHRRRLGASVASTASRGVA